MKTQIVSKVKINWTKEHLKVIDHMVEYLKYPKFNSYPAEKNYFLHSGTLEFLALKWAVMDKFKDYRMNGLKFEEVTDNNPLTCADLSEA